MAQHHPGHGEGPGGGGRHPPPDAVDAVQGAAGRLPAQQPGGVPVEGEPLEQLDGGVWEYVIAVEEDYRDIHQSADCHKCGEEDSHTDHPPVALFQEDLRKVMEPLADPPAPLLCGR